MRIAGLVTGLILLVAASARAQKLPEKIGYTIFVAGVNVGRSDISVTYGKGTITFDSRVDMKREKNRFEMVSRTVVDASTFYVKSYEFEGRSQEDSISGRVEIDGLEVTVTRSKQTRPTVQVLDTGPVLLIENFVVEHEIILARMHAAAGINLTRYEAVFPSSGAFGQAAVETSSRASVESTIKEAVCYNLVVAVESAGSFASYYDPGRGLPVYLAFPAVETEIFLDEFHGDDPVSRWKSNAE